MATYYVDTSQTFNGDGTSSSGAASDGAAGAANSAIQVLTATHGQIGSLLPGDKVYVRTKASGANLEEVFTTSVVGSTSVTDTDIDDVLLVFDDGTVWGESGQFTFRCTTESSFSFPRFLTVDGGDASDRRLRFHFDYGGFAGTQPKVACKAGYYSQIYVYSPDSGVCLYFEGKASSGDIITAKDVLWQAAHAWYNTTTNFPFAASGYGTFLRLINPIIDQVYVVNWQTTSRALMQFSNGRGGSVVINGGSLLNCGENAYVFYTNQSSDQMVDVFAEGLSWESTVSAFEYGTSATFSGVNEGERTYCVGCGLSEYNYHVNLGKVLLEYNHSDIMPTLTAKLPNAASTPWSYKAYIKGTSRLHYIALPEVNKWHSQTSATRSFTMEFFALNTLTIDAGNMYMVVQYVDDVTGEMRELSSFDPLRGAVSSSTSVWDNTTDLGTTATFGADTFNKFKITLSTGSDLVKQNTNIKAYLVCGVSRVAQNDYIFVDPDLVVT